MPYDITAVHSISKYDIKDMMYGYAEAACELFEDYDNPEASENVYMGNISKSSMKYIEEVCQKFANMIADNNQLQNVDDYIWQDVGLYLFGSQNDESIGFWDAPDKFGADCDILDDLAKKIPPCETWYDEDSDQFHIGK